MGMRYKFRFSFTATMGHFVGDSAKTTMRKFLGPSSCSIVFSDNTTTTTPLTMIHDKLSHSKVPPTSTLYTQPSRLNPLPSSLNTLPLRLNSHHSTLNTQSSTHNPSTPQLSTLNRDPQHSILNPQLLTLKPQHSILYPPPSTPQPLNPQATTFKTQPSLANLNSHP